MSQDGITLLLINLSNQTEFKLTVRNSMNIGLNMEEKTSRKSFIHGLKRVVSWVGSKSSDRSSFREEYHLAPKDGELQSKTMLLNGKLLQLADSGDIPNLEPVLIDVNSPMSVPPLSIKFILLPTFDASGCK